METKYITIRIDYSVDENHFNYTDEETALENAIDLAIRPNYNSVVDGVSLENVEICNE